MYFPDHEVGRRCHTPRRRDGEFEAREIAVYFPLKTGSRFSKNALTPSA